MRLKRLVFPAPSLSKLRSNLLETKITETCAVAFTSEVSAGLRTRLLVRSSEIAPIDAYETRTEISATLRPEYVLDVVNRARRANLGCVFAHSHPHDPSSPCFSRVDDRGEQRLRCFLDARHPLRAHSSLVVSPGGVTARVLGANEELAIEQVGTRFQVISDDLEDDQTGERFDRQVRAFGREGQRRISQLKIAVVGLGGTGSITVEQLAHLGANEFVLVDFDPVEKTNLNRLVGVGPDDIGSLKTEVAERLVKSINPDARIETVCADVTIDAAARRLLTADLIFLCTDSHASRAVVNQLAYQYLIPVIDMGVSISVRDGHVAYVTGRVQLLAPTLPCLTCMELLDSEQIRREMLSPEARSADPYITGAHEPQPSVISLNGTVASLATTMFLGLVTEAPLNARLQYYDGIKGTVRTACAAVDAGCLVCSASGALGRGDAWPLPTRVMEHA